MRQLALISLALFITVTLLSVPVAWAADTPPTIVAKDDYQVTEGRPALFEDIITKDDETTNLTLEVNWDYDDKVDENDDGVFDNDDELPHFGIYMDAGFYNMTITVKDEANHTVVKKIKVEAIPTGEVLDATKTPYSDKARVVPRSGWVAYTAKLTKDQKVSISVTPLNQSGSLGLVAITETGFTNFMLGTGPFEVIKAYSTAVARDGTVFEFTSVAAENVYFVVVNGRFDGVPAAYTSGIGGNASIKYDLDLQMKTTKTPTVNYMTMIFIIVIGMVMVAVIGAVLVWHSKKPKIVRESIYAQPGVKELTPEEKMHKEWKDYEEMYGIKHPNAPYSLLAQKREQEKNKAKFQNWPCSICGSITSYDDVSKQYFCYKCKKAVQPAAPKQAPGPAPQPQPQQPHPQQHPQHPPPQQQPPPQHAQAAIQYPPQQQPPHPQQQQQRPGP